MTDLLIFKTGSAVALLFGAKSEIRRAIDVLTGDF